MFYPYNRYYYYPYYRKNNYIKKDDDISKYVQNSNNKIYTETETNEQNLNDKNKSSRFNSDEEPFLDILGIKLYLDDLIILCLLFFLYQEGVKDEILFISLILLLLS